MMNNLSFEKPSESVNNLDKIKQKELELKFLIGLIKVFAKNSKNGVLIGEEEVGPSLTIDYLVFHLDIHDDDIKSLVKYWNESLSKKIGIKFEESGGDPQTTYVIKKEEGTKGKIIETKEVERAIKEEIKSIKSFIKSLSKKPRGRKKPTQVEQAGIKKFQPDFLQTTPPTSPQTAENIEDDRQSKSFHQQIREYFIKNPDIKEKEVSVYEILSEELLKLYEYLLEKYQNNEFKEKDVIEQIKKDRNIQEESEIKRKLTRLVVNLCVEKIQRGDEIYYKIIPPEQKRRVLKSRFFYKNFFIFYCPPIPYHNQKLSPEEKENGIWEMIKNADKPIEPKGYFHIYIKNQSNLLKSSKESEEIFHSLYEKGYLEKGYILGGSISLVFYLPRKE
jgi:hypothetical protein